MSSWPQVRASPVQKAQHIYFSTAHSLSGVCGAYGSPLFRHRHLRPPESATHQRLHHQHCQNNVGRELLPRVGEEVVA